MLPEHFYFTGAGWFGYVFYVPFALGLVGLLYAFVLRKIPIRIIRWPVLVILVITLLTAPLWQALSISYQAEKLCKEQGGLHVYRTVEADGFLGGGSIKYWSKYGFKYIEGGCGKYGRLKCRKTMQNSEVNYEEITEWVSQYSLKPGKTGPLQGGSFRINTFQVVDRKDGEVLGDLVYFQISPSLFDKYLLHIISVEFNPWICGNEAPAGEGSYLPGERKYIYGSDDVVKATLKPDKSIAKEVQ